MHLERAEHTLETIRTLMERSQRYEHISGYSGLLAGGFTIVGCAVSALDILPFGPQTSFLVTWSVVFLIAFIGHLLLTFGRARQRREPVWSRQARTVLLAILPNFVAGLAVSVFMWRIQRLELLPAFWLITYGCGALATSCFAPRSIARLGMVCLIFGVLSLLFMQHRPLLVMALGFGMTHLAFGVCVTVTEWKEERDHALLMQCLENSRT